MTLTGYPLIPPRALTGSAHVWMLLMLLPTAEDSGPVQLQIIPRTKGFLELVELGVLDAAVLAALEDPLGELLEPQALRRRSYDKRA